MNGNKKIILASDHAGFALKEEVKKFLTGRNFEVVDIGATEYREDDDYPEYMIAAAMKVAEDIEGKTRAIIFGGSGEGEAIVANRFPGVRTTVWYGGGILPTGESIIKLSREHNDANILSIGARFVTTEDAVKAVQEWLETLFSGEERHVRRNAAIDNIE